MLRRIHLKGVGPAPDLDLEFATHLNLLTGDNGVGKSFLLDIAWWALTGDWAGRQAWPDPVKTVHPLIEFALLGQDENDTHRSRFFFQEQRWEETHPLRAPSLVLYAHVNGTFSVWDSARNDWWPGTAANISQGFDHPYYFTRDSLWEGLIEEGRVLCEGLIRDWVSWQRQGTESFKQLKEVLRVLSPGEGEELRPGEPVRVSLKDVRDHPTLEMPYGTVPLVFASAGMQRVIGFAYMLVWAWQEHVRASKLLHKPQAKRIVFLVDEIESHLHPKWQRLLLPALISIMKTLREDVQIQLLVTTHAPLVLASVEPEFDVKKDALFTFDLVEDRVQVSKADWRRRGDASSWLTSDVFDLKEARSLPAEQAIQRAMEAMRQPDLPIEETKQIHDDLHAVLKDTDPFWPRWLVRAKAAGLEL